MKLLLTPLLVILSFSVGAQAIERQCPRGTDAFLADSEVPSCDGEIVGPNSKDLKPLHLFDIRKSYNPKNVLVVYSQVTGDCKFPDTDRPQELVDLYWRQNEETKSVCKKESAVKERIRSKIKIQSVSQGRDSMVINLNDLNKVKHDLPDRAATIKISKDSNGSCSSEVSFALSSTENEKKLILQCVYGEPVMLFFGIPAPVEEVESLALVGIDENNKPITKRYLR